MSSKALGAGLAALLLAVATVGCTLTEQGLRKAGISPETIGGSEVVAPKRCVLRVMVASRPEGDPALSEAIWRVADEQAIDPETRRILQANGLRIGRASGELPSEVRDVLSAPPPKRVEALTVALPDGDHTLIDPGTPANSSLSLMLGQKDKVVGKVYQDARGYVRLTATFEGEDGVSLRFAPELHHGPIQQGWGVAPGATTMTPGQIVSKNGQKEETFRDMAATLVLKPGQVAVIGGRHDKRGSVGDYLFGAVEPDSDRPIEKVVFLWATRSEVGKGDSSTPPEGLVPIDPIPEPRAAR